MGGYISNHDDTRTILYTPSTKTGESREIVTNVVNIKFIEKYKECKKNYECTQFIINVKYHNKDEDDAYVSLAKKHNLELEKVKDYHDFEDYYNFKFY